MIGIENFQALLTAAVILVPIVTGLTGVVKMALGLTSAQFVPLIAVLIGTCLGILVVQASITGAIVGLVVGLSSVGLYEFGKTTVAGARG